MQQLDAGGKGRAVMRDWKSIFARFSDVLAMLVAMWLVLLPGAARADNLGAIGKGFAILFVLALGILVLILCIILAVMLGRWIAKPSKVSGFVLIGLSLILSGGWFLLYGSVMVSELMQASSFEHAIPILAWGLLGGGVLSIAPLIVVLRCIKLLKILLRKGSEV